MKKHLYVFFVAACVWSASTTVTAQVRFGAKAGLNLSTVDYRVYPGLKPTINPGFAAGVAAELPLPLDLYLNAGLEVQQKGYKYAADSSDNKVLGTLSPVYLQLPVNVILRSSDGGVFGGIGAYMAYGITGKLQVEDQVKVTEKTTTATESILFGKADSDHFRPFDYGISVELGYETRQGIRVTAAYSRGFGDTRKEAIKNIQFISPANHRVISISISYFFFTTKKAI